MDEMLSLNTRSEDTAQLFVATVYSVASDGRVGLKFDGSAANTSAKLYKANKSATFSTGQRVLVARVAGTYVVVCPI